ncbi:MAG: septum formation initiator family protein [Actinomycetes bacterium]
MARRRRLNFNKRRGNSRVLTLATILFVMALTIAPPIKHYFTQRAQISALKSQVTSNNQALEQARKELLMWRDPEYIKSQARERLHFVLPGERQYIVTDSAGQYAQDNGTTVANKIPDGQPWYARMIASITETRNQ